MLFVKNVADMTAVRRKINNVLTGEKGAEMKEALNAILDEMENSEVEYDDEMFVEKVEEIIAGAKPSEKVEAAIAEAIAKRMAAVQNSIKKELSPAVKNQIAAAVLRANGKQEVENAVNAVLVKNDISGLTFGEVIDYAIVENWGDYNPLFKQLHKTFFTKFFYSEEDVKTATLLAKQWDKTGETAKKIQEIAVVGKTIDTRYIYKIQRAANEDLDKIEEAGQMSNFLRFINEELDRMIVNTIVMAITVGDNVNAAGDRVTTFETIGTKSVTDAFTTVMTAAAAVPTIEEARALCDAVKNPFGKKKVALVRTSLVTELSKFKYSGTGTVMFRSTEELAKQLGVDEIIPMDIFENSGVEMEVMLPDGYWYNERKTISVAYAKWENNAQYYQKERNIGGGIHDLLSTAVLKTHAA